MISSGKLKKKNEKKEKNLISSWLEGVTRAKIVKTGLKKTVSLSCVCVFKNVFLRLVNNPDPTESLISHEVMWK